MPITGLPPAKSKQGKTNWLGAIPVDWRVMPQFAKECSRSRISYLTAVEAIQMAAKRAVFDAASSGGVGELTV